MEFIALSFAGYERTLTLEGQLEAFIADSRARGLPLLHHQRACGTSWEVRRSFSLGVNCLIDDNDFIVNEVKKTGALTYRQGRNYNSWIFFLEEFLGSLEALWQRHRAFISFRRTHTERPWLLKSCSQVFV